MMSSWRSGRVISRTSSPRGPRPATVAATPAPSAAATSSAAIRRRRTAGRARRRLAEAVWAIALDLPDLPQYVLQLSLQLVNRAVVSHREVRTLRLLGLGELAPGALLNRFMT